MAFLDKSRERADAEAARADRAEERANAERERADRAERDAQACERKHNPPVTHSRIVPGSFEGGKRR
jgi:hypothetical protein